MACAKMPRHVICPGRGGYSHILAIRVCAAGKGMVFKPFGLYRV